jgi:hypothetical protein
MLANPAEQASAIVYLVLSMVAGLLLVESGLYLGGRLRRMLSPRESSQKVKPSR